MYDSIPYPEEEKYIYRNAVLDLLEVLADNIPDSTSSYLGNTMTYKYPNGDETTYHVRLLPFEQSPNAVIGIIDKTSSTLLPRIDEREEINKSTERYRIYNDLEDDTLGVEAATSFRDEWRVVEVDELYDLRKDLTLPPEYPAPEHSMSRKALGAIGLASFTYLASQYFRRKK